MKSSFLLFMMISVSICVNAQSNISPKNNDRQKRFLDSLRKTLPEPAIQVAPQTLLAYNTPVVPLKNEGEKVGMSGEDTIYRMKKDNMPLLKPNTKTTYIPNAAEGKMFMVPPVIKKP